MKKKVIIACLCAAFIAIMVLVIFLTQQHDTKLQHISNTSCSTPQTESNSGNGRNIYTDWIDIDIPLGKYYRDGDPENDMYIEVIEDKKLQIVSPDLVSFFREEYSDRYAPENTSGLENAAKNSAKRYEGILDFRAVHFLLDNTKSILIGWSEDENGISGYGFSYSDDNTIYLGEKGIFILVE